MSIKNSKNSHFSIALVKQARANLIEKKNLQNLGSYSISKSISIEKNNAELTKNLRSAFIKTKQGNKNET